MNAHVQPGLIDLRPAFNRFAIGRNGVQGGEGLIGPIASAHDEGHHPGLSLRLAFHGPRHFLITGVIGGEKITAHQQDNNVGGIQVVINDAGETFSRFNPAVMPEFYQVTALERLE